MPTLKLHFPEEFLTEENKEDLLVFVNKEIPEKDRQFKDFTAWMRGILRQYAAGSMQSFRHWKSTGTIRIPPVQMLTKPDLKLWKGDGIKERDDGMQGKPYPLVIGGLQLKYLTKAVVWENTYQLKVIESGLEHKNVAALAHYLIMTAILQAQRAVDEEKLRLEEEELEEKKETKA